MTGEENFTVIAAADPEKIRASIAAWTARGLLGPSIWVDPARMDETTTVMGMPVLLVEADGVQELPLREVFGDVAVKLVRVLAVQPVRDDTSGQGEFVRRLWDFARQLDGMLAQTTVLQRINLLIPDSGDITAKSLYESDCELNVVVSPEDRPHEGAIDHGLDRGDVFDAHCAFACATVGALWRAAGTGAFDRLDGLRGGRRGAIVVARAIGRAIDGRSLPDKIVNRLLADGAASLRKYRSEEPNRVFDDDRLVELVAARFCQIEDKVLSYREPPRRPQRPARRILPKTLRMLVRFFLHLTHLKLVEWQRGTVPHLDRAAEDWLRDQAPEKLTGRSVWMTPEELREVAATAPAMNQEAGPLMPAVPPVYPYLWPPLRQVCLGLVDEGRLPAELREEWGSLAPTVRDPGAIAANPDAIFSFEPGEREILHEYGLPARPIRPGDTCAAARLEADLGRLTDEGATNLARADKVVLAECRKRLDDWEERTKCDDSLVGRLVRHVSEQVELARVALKNRRRDYLREEEEYATMLARLDAIRDRLWRYVGIIIAMVLAVAGWSTTFFLTGSSSWAVTGLLAAAGGTAGFVAGMCVLSVVAAEATEIEQEIEHIEARRRLTVAAVREWPTEVQRLGGLYEILLDWGEVIGYLLHRPFGAVGEVSAEDEDQGPRRPEAFKAGRAESSEAEFDDLAAEVVDDVFSPGWISDLYGIVLDALVPGRDEPFTATAANSPDHSPGPFRPEDHTEPDDADDSAPSEESDQPKPRADRTAKEAGTKTEPESEQPPAHARDRLLRGFRSGAYELPARIHVRASIRTALLDLPPERLFSTVVVRNQADDEVKELPAARFLSDVLPDWTSAVPSRLAPTVFSDAGRIDNRETVAQTHLWGVVDHLVLPEVLPSHVRVHVVSGADADPEDHQYQFSLIRLDVSEGCEERDLVLPS
ncbi:hypothetical protein AB0J40_41325 [Amycolatopsis sp. NPDC049691]|uniref:hypothetical protein n=1 Tax=Amycolatopsis sp. NPDC049691 TaxID=3155155 RepID=UPI0034494EDD